MNEDVKKARRIALTEYLVVLVVVIILVLLFKDEIFDKKTQGSYPTIAEPGVVGE